VSGFISEFAYCLAPPFKRRGLERYPARDYDLLRTLCIRTSFAPVGKDLSIFQPDDQRAHNRASQDLDAFAQAPFIAACWGFST